MNVVQLGRMCSAKILEPRFSLAQEEGVIDVL